MDPGQVERLQQTYDSTVAMRLVSWNVNGRYGPALKKQIELVRQADPALVCLQEVRSESVDAWTTALEAKGMTVETTRDLVGERTYFLLLAHRGRQVERKPARSFEVPYPELVLSLLIELYGGALEVITTHVPNGSANGWRKVEHLEGLYGTSRAATRPATSACCAGTSTAHVPSGTVASTHGRNATTRDSSPTAACAGTRRSVP